MAEGVALPLARAEGVRAAFGVVTGIDVVLALLVVWMRRASSPDGADTDAARGPAGH